VAIAAGTLGTAVVVLTLRITGGAMVGGGIWFAAALAPATLFYLLGVNLLVGLKRIASYNAFQLASNYVVLLCLVAAALLGAGPAGFLAACATGWIFVSGCLAITLGRGTTGSLAFRPDVFGVGFRFALKAYVAAACSFLIVRGNVFLLSALKTSTDVGYYSVASQISEVIGILPQSMALVLFPTLITATTGRFRTTMRQTVIVGAFLAIGCVAMGLLAEPFIRAIFGERFLPAVPILRWMLPGVFFVGLAAIPSQYLAASGYPVSLVAIWFCGTAMALSLGRLAIPALSGIGAAMALSVTHGAVFAAIFSLSVLHARRTHVLLADPQTLSVEGVIS
jgi:O-antigen/teichoic acid export membrane protein